MSGSGMAARFAMVREAHGYRNRKAFSEHLGLGTNTWPTIESAGNNPSYKVLMRVIELGYSADWILLGDEPMTLAEKRSTLARGATPSDSDGAGIGRVFDMISEAYGAVGTPGSMIDILERAAEIWAKAKKAAPTFDGRQGAAVALVGELREQLEAQAAKAKRLA